MVNSLVMISGVNCRKIDYQKRFPVVQTYFMCQVALLVDWKRKTILHCNLIPLLEIHLNNSEFVCSSIYRLFEVSFCICFMTFPQIMY